MGWQRKTVFKHVNVCMSTKQYEQLWTAFQNSLEPSMSAYVRKILFGRPVKVLCRDQSYDEFIEAAIQVKKNLTIILAQKWISKEGEAELRCKLSEMIALLIKIDDYVLRNKKNDKPIHIHPLQ